MDSTNDLLIENIGFPSLGYSLIKGLARLYRLDYSDSYLADYLSNSNQFVYGKMYQSYLQLLNALLNNLILSISHSINQTTCLDMNLVAENHSILFMIETNEMIFSTISEAFKIIVRSRVGDWLFNTNNNCIIHCL